MDDDRMRHGAFVKFVLNNNIVCLLLNAGVGKRQLCPQWQWNIAKSSKTTDCKNKTWLDEGILFIPKSRNPDANTKYF